MSSPPQHPVARPAAPGAARVKSRLAVLLKTSRSQVDRLLDPNRDVTLWTLQRAAALVGRKVQIELV